MNHKDIVEHIKNWLSEYAKKANSNGFVVGISGGIDSALTSALCASTGLPTYCVSMPIKQHASELNRAHEQINWLKENFSNVSDIEIDLSDTFDLFKNGLPQKAQNHPLTMANTRSRLRMTLLYSLAQPHGYLVAGTGNKVEDFGIGFYTKYGDGGVDISPIADLMKTEVFELAEFLNIPNSILSAQPTDGLWDEERTDEDQIGATYSELEWAMEFEGNPENLDSRQREILEIYNGFHSRNKHKMTPIPVCHIPKEYFS